MAKLKTETLLMVINVRETRRDNQEWKLSQNNINKYQGHLKTRNLFVK
jgi:hypothetical protein